MPTTIPVITDFTGATVTEGNFKTALEDLHDYLTAILGATVPYSFLSEKANVADDATHAFSTLPDTNQGDSLFMLLTNNLAAEQAIFFSGSTSQVDVGSGAVVVFGGTANPDTDARLNIWVSSGKINMKNRLGSAYDFTLVQLKGNL